MFIKKTKIKYSRATIRQLRFFPLWGEAPTASESVDSNMTVGGQGPQRYNTADVFIPCIRKAEHLHQRILPFQGQVNSPLARSIRVLFRSAPKLVTWENGTVCCQLLYNTLQLSY